MFDYVEFTETGKVNTKSDIKIMVLTTCGFCHKGRTFLDDNDIKYSFVEVDKLDMAVKKKIKIDFSEKFDTRLVYPTLILNDDKFVTGFKKQQWAEELGI